MTHSTKKIDEIFDILNKKCSESKVQKKHACLFQNDKNLTVCCNSNDRSIYTAIYKNPIHVIHAEVNCLYTYLKNHKLFNKHIDYIRKKTKKIIVYVTKSNYGNSKPCQHCINMLKYYGLKKIYYTDDKCQIIKENIQTIITDHVSEGNLNNIYN